MVVPDPNMFGGSVLLSKKMGSDWKITKQTKTLLGKINIRTQKFKSK